MTMTDLLRMLYLPFIEPTATTLTMADYRAGIRAWEKYSGDARTLAVTELRAIHFTTFKSAALSTGKSPATVNKWMRQFRAVLRFAYAEHVIDRLPVMRPVKQPELCKPRPTREQVGDLYAAVAKLKPEWPAQSRDPVVWWQTFIVLAYVGALRVSEVCSARWDDVTEDGIEFRAIKTGRLTVVPLLPCVSSHLERLRAVTCDGQGCLLSKPNGPRQFRAVYLAIGEAAGLPFPFTPHQLRRAGVDNWFATDPTAGHIVAHYRWGVAVRNYLNRREYLIDVAKRLELPAEFDEASVPTSLAS